MYELTLAGRGLGIRASGSDPVLVDHDIAVPVAGAIPFATDEAAALFVPDVLASVSDPFGSPGENVPGAPARVVPIPNREEYTRRVASVVEALRAHRGLGGALRKVVLARRLDVIQAESIDVDRLAALLSRDQQVTTFKLRVQDVDGGTVRALVGASPELLVQKNGDVVSSAPLAGSARRCGDPVLDRSAGERLLASGKDQEEHRLVVEYVLDTLSPLCKDLSAPDAPCLTSTASMLHLETPIEGRLRDPDVSSFALARALHPTPAVCGVPSQESARLIHDLEPFSRGLYGGALGWSDHAGDGRWMVTLRCAEVSGETATLFAGAGIMPDSDPAAECDETSAKFRALLDAFQIDEVTTEGVGS